VVVGRNARAVAATIALLGVGFALWRFDPLGLRGRAELTRALTYRGRIAVLGPQSLVGLNAEGASLVSAESLPELSRALRGRDAFVLLGALAHTSVQALLLQPAPSGERGFALGQRLARYEHVAGLRALFLSRSAVLYAPDPSRELSPAQRDALAVVARALIGGARPPRPSSFPEPMRRLRPVEVMVLLREGERARLWRSARGTSIASALTTAALVARQRWQEREQAMGGPLAAALPRMDLDVALLEDDGTIVDRDPAFIDRVFYAEHGVGYERKGAWRYLLPEATRAEGKGRASRAYRKLFADDGLPDDSFGRHELRLYRLVLETLGTSAATPPPRDALSPVHSPEEVLGPRPK
jgi:hypothetical protein